MKTKTKYADLHILPNIVAETVCGRPYTGNEFSPGLVTPEQIQSVEAQRLAMNHDDIERFASLVDKFCEDAYRRSAKWFLKCLDGNAGRDQLYIWVTHWLVAYLKDKGRFAERILSHPYPSGIVK